MSNNDLSVLDHLKGAAIQLNISNINQNIDGQCEREIAYQINQHYQNLDNKEERTSVQKRKIQQDTIKNKKLKVCHKVVYDSLSSLEKLPNEVYEIILIFCDPETKKNLRVSSRWLYEKTTLMDSMFHEICYTSAKGFPPDCILKTDKTIRICVNVCDQDIPPIQSLSNLINRFAQRISSLKIDSHFLLMEYLPEMRPIEFTHLTSLDLEYLILDNSLLLLAPQLQNLSLSNVRFHSEPLVHLNDKSFTKLKTLKLCHSLIDDISEILMKCCNTLEYLELDQIITWVKDVKYEFTALKFMEIELSDGYVKSHRNLLSKSARSLRSLSLIVQNETDVFSTLVQPNTNLKITSLEIQGSSIFHRKCNFLNVESLLNQCPLIQSLSFKNCYGELGKTALKDLIKLKLYKCDAKCFSSVLNQASKSPLKILEMTGNVETYTESELPTIPELDTIWFHDFNVELEQLEVFFKLFPANSEVNLELVKEGRAVIRRVYGLQYTRSAFII